MTTFSKFMKKVHTKLVSENLMTEEIKNALNSIQKPEKRKVSQYHVLMKNNLNEVVKKYPNVEHKIRFKMAAQISGLIHKQEVKPELAWKIITQRTFNTQVSTEKSVKDEEASSSGLKKRRQSVKKEEGDVAVIEVELEDITNIIENTPIVTSSEVKTEKNDEEMKDDTLKKTLREYVKEKVPAMHVNDRYKIVNKMKKLVNSVSDISKLDKVYSQAVM